MHISEDHLQGHGHSHSQHHAMSKEEMLALLGYMLEHNRHHNEELHDLCHALADAEFYDAANELENAMRYYSTGNDSLETALSLMQSEE